MGTRALTIKNRILAIIKRAIPTSLQTVSYGGNWWNWWGPIREPFTGAWQQNVTIDPQQTLLAFSALYACVTGIASDIAKMRIKLSENDGGIWEEITEPHGNSLASEVIPLLKKPNHYQNRIQFLTQYIVSKLLSGNTYVLKERRNGVVVALYILDPCRVKVLVADDGSIYYELRPDYLSQVEDSIIVPASEIIHDMMCPLWHPLVGVSPIYACGTSVTMGNRIQSNSTNFFQNASRPSGILTAPGMITDAAAASVKARFESGYSGVNSGKIAVVGDGLKFEQMTLTAEASQTIDQLQWTVTDVARAFHYPEWKLGGPLPPYSSGPETLTLMYYTDCLQPLIESLELSLDEGLDLPGDMGTEMDLDNLLRMDTTGLYAANNLGVGGGWLAPNEARFRANYHDVSGGESPMIQQQNYSLAALAKRDAQADPFASKTPTAQSQPPTEAKPPQSQESATLRELLLDEDEMRAIYEADFRRDLIPA